MITKIAMLDGIEHTVLTPVINTVIEDINNRIIKDDSIIVHKEEVFNNDDTEVADNTFDNTTSKRILKIGYETEYMEEFNLTTSTYKPLNKIIIQDQDNGLTIRPNYIYTKVKLKLEYNDYSKVNATSILNKFKTYWHTSGYTMGHDMDYGYILPPSIMDLLKDVNILKNGTTVDLLDYIDTISIIHLDKAILRNGAYKVPAFRGKYAGTIGSFLMEPSGLEISKNKTDYVINIEYEFEIQYPISLTVQYPLLINNQRLPDKWIPTREAIKIVSDNKGGNDIPSKIAFFFDNGKTITDILVKIPSYDNFVPYYTRINPDMIKLTSLLLEVDPNDPYILFSISDLTLLGFQDSIVNYLNNANEKDLFVYGNSLFYIELFEFNNIKNMGLYKDGDVIKVITPLSITKTYHLLINMVTDLGMLSFGGVDRDIKLKEAEQLLLDLNIDSYYNTSMLVSLPDDALIDEK